MSSTRVLLLLALGVVSCSTRASSDSSGAGAGSKDAAADASAGSGNTSGSDAGDAGDATESADDAADGSQGNDGGLDGGSGLDATTSGEGGSGYDGGAADARTDGAAGGLDYMIGIKTNGVPTGPAKVQAWLGRPVDLAGTTITTTSYIGSGSAYTNASGAHPLLECSFPLLSIFGESNDLDDMAQAASGSYDATYEAMSEALAAWPNPLLSVRIGLSLIHI